MENKKPANKRELLKKLNSFISKSNIPVRDLLEPILQIVIRNYLKGIQI